MSSLSAASNDEQIKIPIHIYKNPTVSTQTLAVTHLNSTQTKTTFTNYEASKKKPFAILSPAQTHGMGTNKRMWQSPLGNLYLTVAIPYDMIIGDEGLFPITMIPLKVGGIVRDAVDEVLKACTTKKDNKQPEVLIKWPNDILINQLKIAGVLIQLETTRPPLSDSFFLIGVGVNVGNAPLVSGAGVDCGRGSCCFFDFVDVDADDESACDDICNGHGNRFEYFSNNNTNNESDATPSTQRIDKVIKSLTLKITNKIEAFLTTLQSQKQSLIQMQQPQFIKEREIERIKLTHTNNVVSDFTLHSDFKSPIKIRSENQAGDSNNIANGIDVVPLMLEVDGCLRVREVDSGVERILIAEYLV